MSSSEPGASPPAAPRMDERTGAARSRSLPARLLSLAARHSDRLVNDGLAAADVVTGLEDEVLAPLGPAERDQLARLLARLVDHHARRDCRLPGTLARRSRSGLRSRSGIRSRSVKACVQDSATT